MAEKVQKPRANKKTENEVKTRPTTVSPLKRGELELSNGVYEEWLKYKKKNGREHDSGAMYHLLQELRYTENEILNIVQCAVECIVYASKVLSEEDMSEKIPFLTHYVCECSRCEKDKISAHTDLEGRIAVSRRHFTDLLQPKINVAIGLLDLMYSYLHEAVHNIYPDAPKDIPTPEGGSCSSFVRKKTKEIWCKGMANISDDLDN